MYPVMCLACTTLYSLVAPNVFHTCVLDLLGEDTKRTRTSDMEEGTGEFFLAHLFQA